MKKQRKRLAHAVHEIKQMHEHYINILDASLSALQADLDDR